jgi:hypothetical protein
LDKDSDTFDKEEEDKELDSEFEKETLPTMTPCIIKPSMKQATTSKESAPSPAQNIVW